MQIFLVLAFGVLAVFAVKSYPSGYGALSPRSRMYRTACTGMLLLLIAVAWIGFSVPDSVDKILVIRKVSIWLVAVLLSGSLVMTALLDALESYSVVRKLERIESQRLATELKTHPVPQEVGRD